MDDCTPDYALRVDNAEGRWRSASHCQTHLVSGGNVELTQDNIIVYLSSHADVDTSGKVITPQLFTQSGKRGVQLTPMRKM